MTAQTKKFISVLVAVMLFVLMSLSLQPLGAAEPERDFSSAEGGNAWQFRVYLDDREIGYHHFYLAENGDVKQLRSVASFEYKLLFVKLFHYEHENLETWNGDCLQSIDSQTDANGKPFRVDGRRSDGQFRVNATAGDATLPECVMTFAYWNPEFLEQPRLLNPQTGEYVDISVEQAGSDILEVRGQQVPATRFRLTADDFDLTLWYSPDDEWLALESVAKGGHIIRYELS